MLISVPLLATLKSILISQQEGLKEQQPVLADFAGGVLACLEGRRHKDQRRRSTWLLPFAAAAAPEKPASQELAVEVHKLADPSSMGLPVKGESPPGPKKARPLESAKSELETVASTPAAPGE